MKTQTLEYTDGKKRYVGYLAYDEARRGRRPGIVVFPEAFGLGEHAKLRAQRLAELGYVALAADMNGDGLIYQDMAQLGPALGALFSDRPEWRGRARAAYDTLLAQAEVDPQRTAAIGYCFGGATALELVRSGAPLAAVATFHAGLVPELAEDQGRIRSQVLICHGADDPLMKQEVLDAVMAELKRDKVAWELIYFGNTVHSFTNPDADKLGVPALAYNRRADERSWVAMRELFTDAFR